MTSDSLYDRPCYPLLIVISGPSGVGKDTVARALIQRRPDDFYFVVTATTRQPRPEEVHGRDYLFLEPEAFARMIEQDELLEYAVVYNDYKGVPKSQIRQAIQSGRDVIMRVDVQGAATIRRLVPNATFIFLSAESETAMLDRLRERKSETPEGLSIRIANARKEMQRGRDFDYWVVNSQGRPDVAVDTILAIMAAERTRVDHRPIEL